MPLEWKHWQGQIINNRFELGEYLGGSDATAVFRTSFAHPEKAAIKLIALDAQNPERQLSQWRSAQKFSHAHIIRLLETGQCSLEGKQLLYVVMEYAEENLSTILPTRALTVDETREMLDPTLDALAYIHSQGFVHGHIKPSNIMAVDEKLKISCDGITPVGQAIDNRAKRSSYLPPEAANGELAPSADVWSLGVTLVEVLTQQRPAVRSDRDRQNVLSALPFPFGNIAAHCLYADPQQRSTIAEIQEMLHPSLPAAIPAASPLATSTKRRSLIGPVAIIVLLAAVLAGAFLFKHRSAQPEPSEPTGQAQIASQPSVPAQPKSAADSDSQESAAGPAAPGKVIRRVLPDVSTNALRTIHGTIKVKARVYVDPGGNVEKVRLESAGPSRYFANKAFEAAKQWKFDPPVTDGKSVPSEWDLEFRFNRSSRQVRELHILP